MVEGQEQGEGAPRERGGGCCCCRKAAPGRRRPGLLIPALRSLLQVNNAILFDKTTFEKMLTEVPKYKMITISILSDRLRINCSLARRALAVLVVRPSLGGRLRRRP